MKRLLAALMIGAFLFATPVPSMAAKQVTLAWDEPADADIASYKIFFRPATQQNYDFAQAAASVPKGTNTVQVTIPSDGYFVARSVDTSGNQSVNSNEIDTVKPGAPGGFRVTVTVEVNQ